MYSILKLPVAFSSQNIMTFDISCILGLQDSTNYGPGYLSDLTSYYSSRHASHTDLLAISQPCQASTLPPQDLHICFSPLEHCFRYRHGFHPYFLEVCAQMSSLQRSLSWSPVLSHHHSIHFTLLFLLLQSTSPPPDSSISFCLSSHTRMKASGEQGLSCMHCCVSSTENSTCHTIGTR